MNIVEHALADLALKVNEQPLTNQIIESTVIKWVGGIAGVVAFFYMIVGGFTYLTSAGNPEQAKKGSQTLVNAAIGIVVIILSYALTEWIINTLK